MTLSIPALSIAGAILVGSPWINGDNHIEAQEIMKTSIYKFADYEAYGAHDYSIFQGLNKIKLNTLVIIDKTRCRVAETFIVHARQSSVLTRGPILFTCINGVADRFIVKLNCSLSPQTKG